MNFATRQFVLFYLLVFAAYWIVRRPTIRKALLLAASYHFYMSWNRWLISLILASTALDYALGLILDRTDRPRVRRAALAASCAGNLGLLALFKYAGFFAESLGALASALGVTLTPVELKLVLPVGISFYTFQTLSYTIDVYRRRMPACRSALDFALFVAFFPQLVAGPIVRAESFLPQLQREVRWDGRRMLSGLALMVRGLAKKIVLADSLAIVADRVFDAPLSYGTAATWYGVVAFAIQIYCDFSGYSDVAIGTARMLGFDLPSNFDHPCLADSPSNFWRRWHISLSTWLRDYLYIPLGGNRRGTARTYANLAATMLLGGLWHGAAWTFVAWGAYQGALLCAGRAGRWESPPGPLKRPLVGLLARLAAMWVLVLIGWVFFRARTFADAGRLLAHMAGFGRPAVEAWVPTAGLWLIGLFGLTQLAAFARERYGVEPAAHPFVKAAVLTGCVVGILAFSRPVSTAFIYFQF
ncbi:MAG: MBOAT family protein [Planctomycetes bacterium]|nr:MBOAT family protein [Planctomycetota bacterium]